MDKFFISYRRTDSADQAGRIFDRLVAAFSRKSVFKDVDSVPAGADFRTVIEEAVRRAEIVLLIIGPAWLNASDKSGHRRLDDPNDFVRLELESALRFGKLIIPVLVRGGAMPSSSELPATLREVAFRNAVSVRPDPDFHRDMDRLIEAVKARMEEERRTSPPDRAATRTWIPFVFATLGIFIFTIIYFSYFHKGQNPPIQAKNGDPENKPRELPAPLPPSKAPSAPSKYIPTYYQGSASEWQIVSADIKTVQGGPVRPSPQSPRVPSDGIPPAPAPGRRLGFLGPLLREWGHFLAAVPLPARKTVPGSDARSSEEVPPPPFVPISSHQRSS